MTKDEWLAIFLGDKEHSKMIGVSLGAFLAIWFEKPALLGITAVAVPTIINMFLSSMSDKTRVINENNPSESKKPMEEALMTGSLVKYVIAGFDDKYQKQILYLYPSDLKMRTTQVLGVENYH